MGNKETFLRDPPAQSRFGPWFYETKLNALGDIPFVGILSFFVAFAAIQLLLSFGLISQISNIRDKKERSQYMKRTFIRYASMFFMIFLGWAILAANFSYTWKEDELEGVFPYRAGSSQHVHATIGVHVGLRGLNITLLGEPKEQDCQLIQWNEQYLWSEGQNELGGWLQGRFGFGPYSNLLAQQFRAGQWRGTPIPILEVLEWFTIDGELIRWNRWFISGGYYCHIFLWLAFTFWAMTIVVTFINAQTGALWLALTGVSMWFAAALYHGLTEMAEPTLRIPFDNRFLEPKFGWAFHMTLALGVIVNVLGLALYAGYRYLGFNDSAFVLSFADHKSVTDTKMAAIAAQYEERMQLEDVTTTTTATSAPAGTDSGNGFSSAPDTNAIQPRRGFQQTRRSVRNPFARGYSVMNSGTSRRGSQPFAGSTRSQRGSASSVGSGGHERAVHFAEETPYSFDNAPSHYGSGMRARSSRRTKKVFGRPANPTSERGQRSVRHKDTFEATADVLRSMGNDGLGTLDEDPTEDSDGVVYNVTDDHQDDNDDDVGVEAVDLDDALARRDSHGQGQPSSHQETAI